MKLTHLTLEIRYCRIAVATIHIEPATAPNAPILTTFKSVDFIDGGHASWVTLDLGRVRDLGMDVGTIFACDDCIDAFGGTRWNNERMCQSGKSKGRGNLEKMHCERSSRSLQLGF